VFCGQYIRRDHQSLISAGRQVVFKSGKLLVAGVLVEPSGMQLASLMLELVVGFRLNCLDCLDCKPPART
jgi:hypothetical protein